MTGCNPITPSPELEQGLLPCLGFGRVVFFEKIDKFADARRQQASRGKLLMRFLYFGIVVRDQALRF